MLSVEDQLQRIRHGVARIEPEAELVKKLERSVATGRPLRIKFGIDPTGVDVHLGHTVPLRKLRLFQDLGHTPVLIIGTATALVGDPSGREKARVGLTAEQIEANARDYLAQIGKIIDLDRAEVRPNNDWFGRWGFGDVLGLLGRMTLQRMLERDDFTKRREAGTPIYMHECLYPLMQGHDSVEIQADVELGGDDQLFNLMVGRHLQTAAGQEPQIAVTLPILRGRDGVRRMGKSLDNYISVAEPAETMFAQVMSIPDDLMSEWFTLLTSRSPEEVHRLTNSSIDSGEMLTHPMQAKKLLAADIVTFYHDAAAAKAAQTEWENRFSARQDPSDIPEVLIPRADLPEGGVSAVKLLQLCQLVKSGNEAKQLLGPKSGVTIGPDREKITDPKTMIDVSDGLIVRVGTRRIARVKLV
jgi:tyrosyl-tRNA synthetase